MKQIFLEEPVLMLESQFRASLNELPQINSDWASFSTKWTDWSQEASFDGLEPVLMVRSQFKVDLGNFPKSTPIELIFSGEWRPHEQTIPYLKFPI